MITMQLLIALTLLAAPSGAAVGDPCAAARPASPLPSSRGRIVIERDAASYVARHAELACAGLEALLRDPASAKGPLAPIARAIEGELETGMLEPIFRLYPEWRGRDLTAADAPGAQVKLDPFGQAPTTPQMSPVTANHLRWVADDADRRFRSIFHTVAGKRLKDVEDLQAELSFVAAPAYRSYPALWKIESRELEKRAPKQPRTAQSDANFRSFAPPPGSVTLTPAAATQMRVYAAELKGHGCMILGLSWSLGSRWKGPDDKEWHEAGPALGLGGWNCGQFPPDVVRTVDGMQVVFTGDQAHSFTGKTVDFDGKHFFFKGG